MKIFLRCKNCCYFHVIWGKEASDEEILQGFFVWMAVVGMLSWSDPASCRHASSSLNVLNMAH